MKIRTGFVSNSSSSSFVCVTTKKEVNRLLKDETPYGRAVIRSIMSDHILDGKELVLLAAITGNISTFDYLQLDIKPDPEKDPEWAGEIWYEFKSKLKNLGKGKRIIHTEDV